MSHEVIYDQSYLKKDGLLRSFDITDSVISGLCSNSSRIEDDKTETSGEKFSNNSVSRRTETSDEKSNKLKSFDVTDSAISGLSSNYSITEGDKKSSNKFVSKETESTIKTDSSNDQLDFSFRKSDKLESESRKSESDKIELTDEKSESSNVNLKSNNEPLKQNKVSNKKSQPLKSGDRSKRLHMAKILSSRADPFNYDRESNIISYNFDRCVDADAIFMVGGKGGNFIFDPSNQTSVIGGLHNKTHNCSNSSIINCFGVKLKNCKETVALGIKATDDDEFPEDLDETLLVRNLYVAGSISAANIKQNSIYVSGNPIRDVYHQITRGDGVDVIYANPIDGIIWIQFGVPNDASFEANRTITIKDATLETGKTSSNNINIVVPPAHNGLNQTRIEYYNGRSLAVSSDKLTGYVINTAGGSVTYKYMEPFMPGQSATWVIQQQFLGNPRTCSFPSTTMETRAKIIKNY